MGGLSPSGTTKNNAHSGRVTAADFKMVVAFMMGAFVVRALVVVAFMVGDIRGCNISGGAHSWMEHIWWATLVVVTFLIRAPRDGGINSDCNVLLEWALIIRKW